MGLTNLLFYLREVALQDSAFLMLRYPRSPVWLHPVFQHRAYLQYAQEVRTFAQEEERPSQLAVLTQAIPVLSDFLQSIDMRNEARIMQLDQKLEKTLGSQSQQGSHILSLLSNGLTVHIKATDTRSDGTMGVAITATTGSAPSAGPAVLSSSTPAIPQTATSASPPTATPAGPQTAGPPPQHSMSRAVKTVEGLWKEWTVGLYDQPAIRDLDSRWGNSWRAGRRSELQWYSLRLEVIREIERIARNRRIGEEAAMYIVHLQQQRTRSSMDQFCKQLRAHRKALLAGKK
ncbi:high-osmolarity-induced transcription protein 1 [Rhypophila decipiens]